MKHYDIIWIGTGQATGTAVPQLAQEGKSIAVIEGGLFGGSCVNYGCTPTKTLVAAARAAHMVHRAPDFGIETGTVSVDFHHVMERQRKVRRDGSKGMEQWLRGMQNVDVYDNYGQFEDAHTLKTGGTRISGDKIVIHAGCRPRRLELKGIEEVDALTNEEMLDLQELPKHLIIAGGSYISLEFAQIFRRLGSEVTILERSSQLMFREDPDIAAEVQKFLEEEGVTVKLNSSLDEVEKTPASDISISFFQEGDRKTITGSHFVTAVGRIPNSDSLALEKAGVDTDSRGYISVNDHLQSSVPHIFALGDINGKGAFTHTSVHDGEVFLDFIRGEGDQGRRVSERYTTYALYTDPPLGRVGMTEKQARKSGRNVLMSVLPMSSIARAREKDETSGLVKILADADSEEFLGAAVLGTGGDEVINMFTAFMYTHQSWKVFRRAMVNHPTVAELMPFILDNLKPL